MKLVIPEQVLGRRDVRDSAKLLLGVMLAGDGDMSITRARHLLGMTEAGARYVLNNLVERGLVTRRDGSGQGHPNVYRVRETLLRQAREA